MFVVWLLWICQTIYYTYLSFVQRTFLQPEFVDLFFFSFSTVVCPISWVKNVERIIIYRRHNDLMKRDVRALNRLFQQVDLCISTAGVGAIKYIYIVNYKYVLKITVTMDAFNRFIFTQSLIFRTLTLSFPLSLCCYSKFQWKSAIIFEIPFSSIDSISYSMTNST